MSVNVILTKEQAILLMDIIKEYWSYDEIQWDSATFREHIWLVWTIQDALNEGGN